MDENKLFDKYSEEGITYIKFNAFQNYDILNHCLTTKIDKDLEQSEDIYKILCEQIKCNYKNLVCIEQDSEFSIKRIDEKYKEKLESEEIQKAKGVITNISKMPLAFSYDNSIPILFFDPVKEVIGICGVDWDGTLQKNVRKMILEMNSYYTCNPMDIIVAIGPAINKCCFEVEEEKIEQLKNQFENIENFITKKDENTYAVDLIKLNIVNLLEVGVKFENIIKSNICVSCDENLFEENNECKIVVMELK